MSDNNEIGIDFEKSWANDKTLSSQSLQLSEGEGRDDCFIFVHFLLLS